MRARCAMTLLTLLASCCPQATLLAQADRVLAIATALVGADGGLRLRGTPNVAEGQRIEASSNAGAAGAKYHCATAVDGVPSTWWASADRAPLPQWLRVTFRQPQKMDAVGIVQADNPALYARWKDVEIGFSDGSVVTASLPDDPSPQIIRFPARDTQTLQVTIRSVHSPNHYVTCAELMALYDPERRVDARVDPRAEWDKVDLTQTGRSAHPCVYQTTQDVARARERCAAYPWAAEYRRSVLAEADRWLDRPDDWYRQVLPKSGACFAYGFTGCPICNAGWGTWGGARCSWDAPGRVTCSNGHVLPDPEHPDDGTGFKGPDGRIHYFVGSYNAWVVEKLAGEGGGATEMLALAYSLTGEERYAEKAGVILDALAAIYPGCDKGSWDYPSDPPSGRFDRPWYQVARVLVHYVESYDQVFPSASLEGPSVVAGLTRRQNIEENLLKNGAAYCYRQSLSGGLHNGEADYLRGVLAVGCCLGIEGYVQWALNGPYGILNMIENNCDREGRYYETSTMYANHTRELYLTFSEPLINYRSARYPQGVNLYGNAKFRNFYVLPELGLSCQGHSPRYGDSGPDNARDFVLTRPFSRLDYDFAERLYARAASAADRADFATLVAYLANGDVEKARSQSGHKQWLLFHAADPPAGNPTELSPTLERRIYGTDFFGQKGIAILRAGAGAQGQAALLRYGPTLNHGHLDDLNLNYYGLGYELTYDLGYGLGSTHTQVGWSHQTASHNLVVVDGKSQGTDTRDGSGGSLLLLADFPGLQVVEADSPASYRMEGVTQYRRLLALVGDDADRYLLDIFRVRGGSQHDYVFHSQAGDAQTSVPLGDPEAGSLAGPDIAWAEKQLNDGDMAGFPNRPYWNPPPGNGYGFLVKPRRARTADTWQATFPIAAQDDCRLRLTMLGQPDTEVIRADAPGILPRLPRAAYLLARRAGAAPLQSTFVGVMEPYCIPTPPGMASAGALAASAQITAGEKRLLGEIGVLLFKGTQVGDRLTVTMDCPADGDWRVVLGHYISPGYGTVRLLVDGTPQGQAFSGSAGPTGPAAPRDMGTVHLTAGPHQFALELTAPSATDTFWFGLQSLRLAPANDTDAAPTAASPFLEKVTRLTRTGPTRDDVDPVGLEITHTSGEVDLLFSGEGPTGAGIYATSAGNAEVSAAFAFIRHSGQQVREAGIAHGTHLAVADFALSPQIAAWTGTVGACDYSAQSFLTDAVLPTDGRLNGKIISFQNPKYTRTTSYRIDRVEAAGQLVRVILATPTTLGKVQLDEDPVDERTITSLIPHGYCRCLQRTSAGFFDGKLLCAVDGGPSTHVTATAYGQPMTLNLESTQGLHRGDELQYCDTQAGDGFTIDTEASLRLVQAGRYELRCECDTDLALPVAEAESAFYRTERGTWVRLEAGRGTVPFDAARGEATTLVIGRRAPQ